MVGTITGNILDSTLSHSNSVSNLNNHTNSANPFANNLTTNFISNFASSANASYLIDKHNRKLHNSEIDKINELARLYAKEKGISQEEAINELILAASINVDRDTIRTPYAWLTKST